MSESAPFVRLFVSVDGDTPSEVGPVQSFGEPVLSRLLYRKLCNTMAPGEALMWANRLRSDPIRDQENRIRVAIDDLVEFLNVMGAD